MMTSGVWPPSGHVDVLLEVIAPKLALGAAAIPKHGSEIFVSRTREFMVAQARRPKQDRARVIQFLFIDSGGTCALVGAGSGSMIDKDVYEKRDGSWHFVRRVGGSTTH